MNFNTKFLPLVYPKTIFPFKKFFFFKENTGKIKKCQIYKAGQAGMEALQICSHNISSLSRPAIELHAISKMYNESKLNNF